MTYAIGTIKNLELFRLQLNAILADIAALVRNTAALDGVTANTSLVVPGGYIVTEIYIVNTTANAITGGLKIGTTAGGSEIATRSVAANEIVYIPVTALFSTSADQTLYLQAVTSWNSASLKVRVMIEKAF